MFGLFNPSLAAQLVAALLTERPDDWIWSDSWPGPALVYLGDLGLRVHFTMGMPPTARAYVRFNGITICRRHADAWHIGRALNKRAATRASRAEAELPRALYFEEATPGSIVSNVGVVDDRIGAPK